MEITSKPFEQSSVSQQDTFNLCNKKWWLTKRMRLPSEDKDYFHYGTALHTVAEKYQRASDTGRDADGNPVKLFAKGWDEVWDRGWDGTKPPVLKFRYTPEQAALVRSQIEAAILNGTLERLPGREVEYRFEVPIGDTGVILLGFMDVKLPQHARIEDHKTAKNAKYSTTVKKLEKGNNQLLIYSKVLLEELRVKPGADPEGITVRHNIYRKDGSKDPYSVQHFYTAREIDAAWHQLIEATLKMKKVATIRRLSLLDDPSEGACWAYGGCEFQGICTRRESLDQYKRRVTKLNRLRLEKIKNEYEGKTMGLFDDLMDRNTEDEGTPVEVKVAEVVEPVEVKVVEPVEKAPPPPWTDPECGACEDNEFPGFSGKGRPCRICLGTAASRGISSADMPSTLEVGEFTWARPVVDEVIVAPEAVEAPDETFEVLNTERKAGVSAEDDLGDEVITLVNTEELKKKPRAKASKEKKEPTKGRPKKTFTLCLNCGPMVTTGSSMVLSGIKLFHTLQEELAEEQGVDSYYELNAFARRDLLAEAGEAIAATLGTKLIFFSSPGTPDVKAFIDVLEAYASTVIVGTAG
ncbi:MAG: PD-(D/E)XK nuclease family protein [Rhodobacteraceae bacterium]|nr:PD-(D/E)XK nuclease family protein [Paracoccaceae bacterium]